VSPFCWRLLKRSKSSRKRLAVGQNICTERDAICSTISFSIIYLDDPDTVTFVAIAHNKRRPEYWRQRI